MDLKRLEPHKSSSKKSGLVKLLIVLIILVGLALVLIFWRNDSSSSSVFKFPILSTGNALKSTNDRVNVLLLGNSGGKHDGPYLTDSIIVASYNIKTHNVVLISIPRDLWLDNAKSKVNAVYEVGLAKGDGLKYSEDKIDDILGVPIHYGVRLDFSGFEKAIDTVGGVDVEVAKTFDDFNYPIAGNESDLCGLQEKEIELTDDQAKQYKLQPIKDQPPLPDPTKKKYKAIVGEGDKVATTSADFACRYEHIHYDKGPMHMDGVSALKFVRSRMGTNAEGSDFARSRRQQLVIQAFRGKVLSPATLINPSKIAGLINALGSSVETDIPADKFLEFFNLVKKQEKTQSVVLGDLGEGKSILVAPPASEYGAYVLIPPNNDFTSVKEFLKKTLEQ